MVIEPAREATSTSGPDSSESILGLLKSLKIRAQNSRIYDFFCSESNGRLEPLTGLSEESKDAFKRMLRKNDH